jgi:DNA-binding NarL/FixJ family response regulator
LKEIEADKLYNAITETLGGGAAMSPSIAVKTLKLLRYPEKQESLSVQEEDISLSSREKEVLEQLAEGLSYTVIAKNLFLSPSTVRKHIENIYKKLQVHNKLEAVQKARRQSLI